MSQVITTVREQKGSYVQDIQIGPHQWLADLPEDEGGQNKGPDPMEILAAALGACTSMTLRMYASRKQMQLTQISVTLWMDKIEVDGKQQTRLNRELHLEGTLNDAEQQRLLEIANKCPVAKTLSQGMTIATVLAPG